MNKPAIGSPASRSSKAATEESTPPDMPTMVRGLRSRQLLQQRQGMAAPGEVVRDRLPDQRAAMARLRFLQLGRGHPQRAHDAFVEPAGRVVRDRLGGEGEAQVMAAVVVGRAFHW